MPRISAQFALLILYFEVAWVYKVNNNDFIAVCSDVQVYMINYFQVVGIC